MPINKEFKKLKKTFLKARKVFRAAKQALEDDPDNAKLKKNYKKVRKVFREAKAAKLAFKEPKKEEWGDYEANDEPEVVENEEPEDAEENEEPEEEVVSKKRKQHDQEESAVKKIKTDVTDDEGDEEGDDERDEYNPDEGLEVTDTDKYNPEKFKTEEPCNTVCKTNLPEDITADRVKKHFGACGGVQKLHFPRNKETDAFLGHAFVEFYVQIGADRAVKMFGEDGEVFFADRGEDAEWNRRNKSKSSVGGDAGGFGGRGECFDFQKGNCDRGDRCKFSHGGSGGGGGGGGFSGGGGGECFDFQKGRCDRGAGCKFSH